MRDDLLEMIRDITEEVDLDSILKPNLGGYTKKSVMDYLAHMKRQQQGIRDACSTEIQSLLDERERLQAEANELRRRALHAEADYQTACLRLADSTQEESGQSAEQTLKLQQDYEALEKDMDEALIRIKDDARKLERYQAELEAERQQKRQAQQEVESNRLLLEAVRGESRERERLIAAQSTDIARLQKELQSMREMVSDGKLAKLHARVEELMGSVSVLQNELSARNQELEIRSKRLDALAQQEEANHRLLDGLQDALQESREQNERLEGENHDLGLRLQEQMNQNIELYRAQSALKVTNAILQRRLSAQQLAVPEQSGGVLLADGQLAKG